MLIPGTPPPRLEAKRQALYQGETMELLHAMPDDFVDCVITDPPYAAKTHANARTLKGKARGKKSGGRAFVSFPPITEHELRMAFEQMGRVARRWVVATVDWEHAAALSAYPPRGLRFVRCGIWVKLRGAPQLSGDRPAHGWEAIVVLHKDVRGRMKWNGGGKPLNLTHAVVQGKQRVHSTQKPEGLLVDLVKFFTNPGDTVLDPYAGSATTLVACARMGRCGIGIERDAGAIRDAMARILAC